MTSESKDNYDRPEISLSDTEPTITEQPSRGSSIFEGAASVLNDAPETHPLAVQKSLKLSFLVTLIVGSCCIYAFRNAGIWNIGLCLSVMGVYWWYAHKRTTTNVAKSVFADSFYYLGFLFTFVALIVTMIGLDTETGNFNAKAIIGQIGPALATTVVGMAVRIYITQFDAITSEPETEIFSGLGELSSNLSSAITALQSMISEHVNASEKQQLANLKLTEKFSSQIENLDFGPAVTALKGFSSEINTLKTQVDLLNKATAQTEISVAEMTSASYRTTTELNKANQEFSRFRDIGKNFDEAKESLALVTDSANDLKKSIDSTAEINILKVVANLDARASHIDENLNKTDNQISRLRESAGDANEALSLSLTKLADASVAVTGITDQMTQLMSLSDDLLKAKDAVQVLSEEVKDINQQISLEIEKTRGELGKTTELTAETLRKEVAPLANAIEQVAANFKPLQQNLQDLDIRVRKSVSDVLDFLNQTDAR
jgi:hypothetical protein